MSRMEMPFLNNIPYICPYNFFKRYESWKSGRRE